MNLGEAIIAQLAHIGVDKLFGIPGVHTAEMYRALPNSGIQHITPRHEQGAAFMADGYARVGGQPGVCMLITGPGLTNAATPIAQAYADSIPMLVISSVNPRDSWGKGSGRLHDLPDQTGLASKICAFSETILSPADIGPVFDRALTQFLGRRPRPVHIQVPIDVVTQAADGVEFADLPGQVTTDPERALIDRAAALLSRAKQPVIIAGGGSVDSGESLSRLVERLDAPLFHTFRAKGVLPDDHPQCGGAYLGADAVRDVIAGADVVLSVGTELSMTDLFPHQSLPINGEHIQIDIDASQANTLNPPAVFIAADAQTALTAIVDQIAPGQFTGGSDAIAALKPRLRAVEPFAAWLHALRAAVPDDTVFVGDSTQLVYAANVSLPMYRPRSWLTSVTGYGTLGYALPAAIGAKLKLPGRAVIALAGDGGLQFTLPELMVAVEHTLALPIIVWHNNGYAEIRDYMINHDVKPDGVDIRTPDLAMIASAYGCAHARVDQPAALANALGDALRRPLPTIIEVPVT